MNLTGNIDAKTANTLASSLFEPIITGIGCCFAAKKVSSIGCGSTTSPEIGVGAILKGASSGQNVSAGKARSCSAVAWAKPRCSASATPF
ncbi:hypothetical protein MYA98_00935 [Salmonella sp. WGH-01]|nr:hypothetical protein MYA98_00935 [Salmonella sp. WGH-01]